MHPILSTFKAPLSIREEPMSTASLVPNPKDPAVLKRLCDSNVPNPKDAAVLKRQCDCNFTKSSLANPFPPHSLRKRPKPQICPKFVPAIVFGVPVRGTEIWKNLSKFVENYRFSNFDKFFQISVTLTGTPKNNRWDKFRTNLGFRAFSKAVRGKGFARVVNLLGGANFLYTHPPPPKRPF